MAEWFTHAPRRTKSVTRIAASVTAVTLLASVKERYGFFIENDSGADCYVKYGTGAAFVAVGDAGNSYTAHLVPGGSLESDTYCGIVTAVWTSASGAAQVTETTA